MIEIYIIIKFMKNAVILYAAEISEHSFENAFGGKSAFELALEWAESVPESVSTVIFASEKNMAEIERKIPENKKSSGKIRIVTKESWTKGVFISEISDSLSSLNANYALVSYADTPFLNKNLTEEICSAHTKYQAEYTFADGYPYGVAPEAIDKGAVSIVSALCKSDSRFIKKSEEKMTRDAVFSLLSIDINSFEVETVIAKKDYRLLRLEFECSSKINFLACRNLFSLLNLENSKISDFDLEKLCGTAASSFDVIKTVPAFYNIQISSRYNHALCYEPSLPGKFPEMDDMRLDDFKNLLENISRFSQKAVISLSAFGEPLLHKDFFDFVFETLKYPEFSLLIETDGTLLSAELAEKISKIENSKGRIDWIILIDAAEKSLYAKIHGCAEGDFSKALESVSILERFFSSHAYPQMVRMKANECELELFYRFWKNPDSPTKGNFIIQKYNSFCGILSDEKSADLSPLERNPCWHLRRDFTVLADGSVPECICQFKTKILGNVFDKDKKILISEKIESNKDSKDFKENSDAAENGANSDENGNCIERVWRKFDGNLKEQINKNYSGCCRSCDEHYTFNF